MVVAPDRHAVIVPGSGQPLIVHRFRLLVRQDTVVRWHRDLTSGCSRADSLTQRD